MLSFFVAFQCLLWVSFLFLIIVHVSRAEDDVAGYLDGYSKLRSWTYSSLDLYKVIGFDIWCISFYIRWLNLVFECMQHELLRVLYPVFVHSFMDLVAKGHLQEGKC